MEEWYIAVLTKSNIEKYGYSYTDAKILGITDEDLICIKPNKLKKGGYLYIADPFFPYLIRKAINRILKLFKVTGKFFTTKEIEEDFSNFGFELDSAIHKGIVQVIKLKKQ